MERLFAFLPLLGAGAIVALAQTKVKERSERAALAMTIGAGLEPGFSLVRALLQLDVWWLLTPVVHVAAIGGVVFGLFELLDVLHPKSTRPLPPVLANFPPYKPNLFLRGFVGVFFGLGLVSGGFYAPLGAVFGLAALAGALYGSVWVERQGPLHTWVLQRRPDLIAWGYVHQLRVVNRRSGTTSVHWTAQLGLSTGAMVAVPATSEEGARQLVAAVLELRPGILLGYSPEQLARFKALSRGPQ